MGTCSIHKSSLFLVGFLCICYIRYSALLFLIGILFNFVLQVCPRAADVVELFIYLGEPCHVCQLLLTISHGADDSTYPSTVDVRTGSNLDGLRLVLEVGRVSHMLFA